MSVEPESAARRWKWVGMYVLFLMGSVYAVPFLVSWIKRNGMGDLLRYGPGVLIAGGLLWLGYRFSLSRRRGSISWIVLFLGVSAGYGFFLFRLSRYPVERVHLLEYGLLAFLWGWALNGRTGWFRTVIYTVTGVLFVGFLDEVLQGLVPRRYYDPRDIVLNVASGFFGILFFFLYRGLRQGPMEREAVPMERAGAWKKDLLAFSLVPLILVGMIYLQRLDFTPSFFYGSWERPSRCGGGMETLSFSPPARFFWGDARGNTADGIYSLEGNRLEPAKINFTFHRVENSSECGMRRRGTKNTVSSEILVEENAFYFGLIKKRPWRKVKGP